MVCTCHEQSVARNMNKGAPGKISDGNEKRG